MTDMKTNTTDDGMSLHAESAQARPSADEPLSGESAPRLEANADEDDDDFDHYDEDYACTHCGGEGFREVNDPLWDYCDEFGYGPCGSCDGTGLRSRQWVF